MQLTIEVTDNNQYNLIQVNDTNTTCLLTDTLNNCIIKFKQTILSTSAPINIKYSYDDSTHLVVDYTQSPFKATDGSTFANS